MYPQLHCILLVMLTNMSVTQARIKDSFFIKYEEDQTIIGKTGRILSGKTNIHCSLMCLSTEKCATYKYSDTGQGNCILIQRNSTVADGELFEIDGSSFFYKKYSGKTWTPPFGWTGPDAALYRSFDNMIELIYMEGTQQRNHAPLVAGKIHSAVATDRTKRQWIDLGLHTEACLTQPETCGTAGGAISLWLNLVDCPVWSGVLSSRESGKTSSFILCIEHGIRFKVDLQDGYFEADPARPTDWTHIVINYMGPNSGEGLRIYYNGAEVGSDTDKSPGSNSAEGGRIVVGRRWVNLDQEYASVQVDELIFFNRALTNVELESIYNSI